MSAQHTPGPWALGCGYGMHGVEVVGNAGNRKVCGVIGVDRDVHDKDGRKVASVADPEGAANARLIAAAPDLLAAFDDLEHLFDGQEDCDDGQPNDAMKVMLIIRAALAKAGAV